MKKEKINTWDNYPGIIKITDKRDKKELKRRRKLKLFQPNRDELYSVNPEFDGNYTS